jgi:hypothetical protein
MTSLAFSNPNIPREFAATAVATEYWDDFFRNLRREMPWFWITKTTLKSVIFFIILAYPPQIIS